MTIKAVTNCEQCGGPVEQTARCTWRYFCSNRCRQAAYRERWAEPRDDRRQCRECDAPIEQPATGRPRQYCSTACRQAAHRR